MTLDESIQGMRLQVIRRATDVGVSAACREAGISRTLFYRWQNACRGMASTGSIHAGSMLARARSRTCRRTPNARSWPWRSRKPHGAVDDSPPNSRAGGA